MGQLESVTRRKALEEHILNCAGCASKFTAICTIASVMYERWVKALKKESTK